MADLVDALHRCHTFLNAVASLGKVLYWLKDSVKDDEIVDERTCVDACVAAEYQVSAKPKHYDNHTCAEELAHRMGSRLTKDNKFAAKVLQKMQIRKKSEHYFEKWIDLSIEYVHLLLVGSLLT